MFKIVDNQFGATSNAVVLLEPNIQSQVASRLRARILSGVLKPGTPIREQALAAEFGISRGPIRDAFLVLSKEGLLTAKPNVGVRVALDPSPFKRALIVDLRRQIEEAALEEWFKHGERALLKPLEQNLSRYKSACSKGEMDKIVELDMEFHRTLVESADEGSLVELWQPIMLRMFLRYSRHHFLIESYSEHLAIYEALKSESRDEAIAHLRSHIQ